MGKYELLFNIFSSYRFVHWLKKDLIMYSNYAIVTDSFAITDCDDLCGTKHLTYYQVVIYIINAGINVSWPCVHANISLFQYVYRIQYSVVDNL